jgi:hypothetical protein
MPADRVDGFVDQARLLECIEAQRCPWCDRGGLRSLANHTVLAHGVYADELRELAGLAPDTPLCSQGLSERHRELARDQDTGQWLHRPEVRAAAAATREANYDDQQRKRRVAQLDAVRQKAIDAWRRSLQAEGQPRAGGSSETLPVESPQKVPRGPGMPDLWRLVLPRRSARSGLPAAQVLQRRLPPRGDPPPSQTNVGAPQPAIP